MRTGRGLLIVLVLAASAAFGVATSAQSQTIQQRLSGPSGSWFGHNVDVDGNVAVVGAEDARIGTNDTQGAAYVYVRSGSTWTQQQRLVDPAGQAQDQFGIDVAVSGTTIVVAAYRAEGPSSNRVGAAFVFVWNGTTWALQAKLKAPAGTPGDIFGQQIDIEGNTIVVGARGANRTGSGSASQTGEAYVFERTGTTWSAPITLPAPNRQAFGVSTSISGNTICIGALGDLAGGSNAVGAAYIYQRTSGWAFHQRLVAPDGAAFDAFGSACDVDGDTLVVGANMAAAPAVRQGAAYVFSRNAGGWQLQQKLTSTGAASDKMGEKVDVLGDWIVAGAPNLNGPGAAFLFERSGTTWTQRQRIQPNSGIGSDGAGAGLALDTQYLFIGAFRLADVAVYSRSGAPPGTPPGQARNFQATTSGNTLVMSWDHPASGGAPTGYTLRARTASGALIAAAPVGMRTTFSTPAPNGVYVLTVQATNPAGAGQESTARTVTVPTAAAPPGNPTGLAVSVSGTGATFTWNAPASGATPTGYLLAAGTSPSFTVPLAVVPLVATPRSLTVTSIPAGTFYVRLLAQNGGGTSGPSNEVSFSIAGATPPGAPTLHAPTVTGTTVGLSWTAGSGGAPASYVIAAASVPGGAPIATAPVSGTSLMVPGAPRGTFYLRVMAINAGGTSSASNEVTLVVP